jgi:GNAT superfamily N-acetyltransferase
LNITIRHIDAEDWSAIDDIQRQAYPEALHEALDVLQQKQALAPESCWVAVDNDNRVQGYLLAHRWHSINDAPELDQPLTEAQGDVLYIHDLALTPTSQGLGLSMLLWQTLIAFAREHSLNVLSLVAVNDSLPFWQHKGFDEVDSLPAEKGYGDDARLMNHRIAF